MCNDDNDCGDGAECIPENTTSSVKKCTCKEDWIEENFKCNGNSFPILRPTITIHL